MKKTINNIFNIVNNVGTVTEKNDILGNNPMEDKVYTKKLNVNKEYTFNNTVDTIEIVSLSLTSQDKNFKDANPNKIRINTKNRNNSWVNIFINEAPKELVEFIYVNII